MAEVCDISERTVYRWFMEGRFTYVYFDGGKFLRIPELLADHCIIYARRIDFSLSDLRHARFEIITMNGKEEITVPLIFMLSCLYDTI